MIGPSGEDRWAATAIQGAAAYLVKPVDPEELAEAARRLSGRFAMAPVDDASAVGRLLLEAAGRQRNLSWIPLEIVWEQVESHILNVGLPQLEQLVDLIAPGNAAGQEAPPLAMAG